MDFILQVCKVEEKDLVHQCDVNKVFLNSHLIILIFIFYIYRCLYVIAIFLYDYHNYNTNYFIFNT